MFSNEEEIRNAVPEIEDEIKYFSPFLSGLILQQNRKRVIPNYLALY